MQRSASEALFRYAGEGVAAVTWAILQSAAFITIAVFLVLIILPAVLAAAGAQPSSGP